MTADSLPGEEWRSVVGYEGIYLVSSAGRVWSVQRPGLARTGRMLRLTPNRYGYLRVALCRHGVQRTREVHVLVAEAFLGPRPEGNQVRHLNGDKTNCSVSNLAYGSVTDNMLDTVRHGRHREARKTHCAKGHPYDASNTRRYESNPRARVCITCKRANNAATARRKYIPAAARRAEETR